MGKKSSRRLPLPKKPPKVEPPKKSYDRKRSKEETRKLLQRLGGEQRA